MPSFLHIGIFIYCLLAIIRGEFKDELQVYEAECLGEDRFHCGDGGCIWSAQHCDGIVDCNNGADESFCAIHPQDGHLCNATDQYTCTDGKQCIPSVWLCNDAQDCEDGSDEANCTAVDGVKNSTCKGFTCVSDGKCISQLWACDGVYDCKDRSDENPAACRHHHRFSTYDSARCSTPFHSRKGVPRECADQSYCLPQDMMCDDMQDCKDGSDEGVFCNRWHKMCLNFTCGNDTKAFCLPDRRGPTCYCEDAATYNTSTRVCDTINLCEEASPYCSQKCEFKNGPFKCSCEEGYTIDKLEIGHACFAPDPEPLLFLSTRTTIGYIKLKSKQVVTVATTKQAHGVCSDGRHIYWVETADGHEEIARKSLDGEEEKRVIVGLGLEDPGDIAIDWQGGNLYFSDAERGVISACSLDGQRCTTLRTDARIPKSVTLDPTNGKMYWADWHGRPVLMRAAMDGGGAAPLAVRLGTFPSGLALDGPSQRLYFVDGTVKGLNLANGKVFTLFEEPIYRPYALSVFENVLYWSDWGSDTVQASDKATGQPAGGPIYKFTSAVMGMHIYHPIVMRARTNPCAAANCSHFCFVTSNETYACSCADGYTLSDKQCSPMKDYRPTYLVVGGGAHFTRLQYHAFGSPDTDGVEFDVGRVQAMAYDSRRDILYLYDGFRKSINSINMTKFMTGITKLVFFGFENVVDMDYDYVSDNLYILDAGRKHVMAASLRTMKQALVYRFGDETPLSLCVLPDYGKMLVTVSDIGGDNLRIDSIGLDGSGRLHVILNDLKGPHIKMRYAHNLNIVYIADEGNHIIEFMHPEGSGRDTYRELSTTITSLAATDSLVLWAGHGARRLYWADAHQVTPHIRRVDLSSFPSTSPLHLQSTSPAPRPYPHGCDARPCAHVCVQTPSSNGTTAATATTGFKCLCAPGLFELDGLCTEAVSCKPWESFCHLSNQCVQQSHVCDGRKDCFHGEDEDGCAATTPLPAPSSPKSTTCAVNEVMCNGLCVQRDDNCSSTPPTGLSVPIVCTSGQFQCAADAVCVERSRMCNGAADCPDGSDEATHLCRTLTCLHTEFMCSTGSCILNSFRCDGEEDCSDGSDEINCGHKTCPPGHFQCRNSECIELKRRCDHTSDCNDYSDEEGCGDTDVDTQEPLETCAAWEYACELNTTICVPLTARCNGKADCPGSTDERQCHDHCAPRGLFQCTLEGHCLPRHQLCNGRKDCSDGSDETPAVCYRVNRTSRIYPIHFYPPEACRDGYMCENGQCIEWREVCDHQPNCFDGSDEGALCFTACEKRKCSHKCVATPKGPTCHCPEGYAVVNSTECRDIDECALEPCSQRCVNVPGSFLCACHRGYAIRSDGRSCKSVGSHMAVVYVSGNSVRSVTADGRTAVEFNDTNVGSLVDVDCDVRRKKLYVTSIEGGKLIEINSTKHEVTITNVGRPTRVAVDWITGNVYFIDGTQSATYIRVCNVQHRRCAKLQRLPANSQATSLLVDPASRLMFYCITYQQESIVWSATLAGGNVQDIAAVHNCTGLAVDSFKRRLFVAQTGPASLSVMDYNGGGRKRILQNDAHLDAPHGLAIFEDHAYYLVANSFRLNRCVLYGQKHCEVYLQRVFDANTFVIRHESVQRDDLLDVCAAFPCDGVCVMDLNGPTCLCGNGETVKDGCPSVAQDELPLFNGLTSQGFTSANKVSHTVVISIVTMCVIYLGVFLYYRCVYKKRKERAENYIPVRFHNTMTDVGGLSPITSPLLVSPRPLGNGGGEYVNPFQFVKDAWRSSFRPSRPVCTSTLKIDLPSAQPPAPHIDVSDTESDIDEKEKRIVIRRK